MSTSKIYPWLLAARPKTLIATVAPIAIGAALAFRDGAFSVVNLCVALASALCIQIGTNLANDYHDFKKGADTAERIGPVRVTQSGLIAPNIVQRAFVLCFALSALLGAYLVYDAGSIIVWVGLAAIASGFLYTAGPWPLAYVGLGEAFVLVFYGPIAVGFTYYVLAHELNATAFLMGACPGALSCAILVANNLRDAKQDKKSQKRTLAVRFGENFAKMEYLFFWSLAYGVVFYMTGKLMNFAWLLPLLTLPLALMLGARVSRFKQPVELIKVLEGTAKTYALFTLLLCVGILL